MFKHRHKIQRITNNFFAKAIMGTVKGQKMKIKNFASKFAVIAAISGAVFLASCGDADGNGLTPMDEDNGIGVMDDIENDMTNGIRRADDTKNSNHITKDAPDYANMNF